MKREIKEKWLQALRSKKYKQARLSLKRRLDDGSYGYCCLGVLAEVCGLDDWKTIKYENGSEDDKIALMYEGSKFYGGLPDRCLEQISMRLDEARMLANMNDFSEMSFEEIANVIEQEIPND
jgi:hypothetical protein